MEYRTYAEETDPAGVCACGASLNAIVQVKREHLPTCTATFDVSEVKLVVGGRRVCSSCFEVAKKERAVL